MIASQIGVPHFPTGLLDVLDVHLSQTVLRTGEVAHRLESRRFQNIAGPLAIGQLSPSAGFFEDDRQPFPLYGWLDVWGRNRRS